MENDKKEYMQTPHDEPKDTTEKSSKDEMPSKNVGTSNVKNTAGEDGLNQARTPDNELEPGTAKLPDNK